MPRRSSILAAVSLELRVEVVDEEQPRKKGSIVGKGKRDGGLYEGHKRKRRRRGAEMSFLEKWWVVVGKKRKQTHYITG